MVRETPLDHVHLPGGRETPLETPIIRESKPPSQTLDPRIVPDEKWPGMYRIRRADGSLSTMANLTRCKDALLGG